MIYTVNEINDKLERNEKKLAQLNGELIPIDQRSVNNLRLLINTYKKITPHLHENPEDKNGNCPLTVVKEYLKAEEEHNYKRVYELLNVPDDISLEEFVESCKNDPPSPYLVEEYYSAEDFIIYEGGNSATVFVSEDLHYKDGRYSSWWWRPWRVVKVDGVWKVDWLPVQ